MEKEKIKKKKRKNDKIFYLFNEIYNGTKNINL